MSHNFTLDHLLLYIYNELPEAQVSLLEEALLSDTFLSNQLEELRETIGELEKAEMEPSETSVQIILEHSLDTHFAH